VLADLNGAFNILRKVFVPFFSGCLPEIAAREEFQAESVALDLNSYQTLAVSVPTG
jgi:hypothetical protein